jgi:hypothetical protein
MAPHSSGSGQTRKWFSGGNSLCRIENESTAGVDTTAYIEGGGVGGQVISDFEFNSVIISILLAFGLSEILKSWGRLVQNRERVRAPGIYCAASGWLFTSLILHWLGLSAYRDMEFERLFQSLIVFSPSIIGASAAFVIAPRFPPGGDLDVDKHYFSVARWAFPLAAAYVLMSGLSDLLVPAEELPPLSVSLTEGALLLCLGFARRRPIHVGVMALLWAMLASIFFFGRV